MESTSLAFAPSVAVGRGVMRARHMLVKLSSVSDGPCLGNRPLTMRRTYGARMQQTGDGGDAEDEAPSDSFVPPGTAEVAADVLSGGSDAKRGALVGELLAIAASTARGQYATPSQRSRIDELVSQLESMNPTDNPVDTDVIDGDWVLAYASQKLFEGSPLLAVAARPVLQVGQVRQYISVDEGRIINEVDIIAFPELSAVVKTSARLTPVGGERLEVTAEKTTVTGGSFFDRVDLGGLSFDIPVEQIYSRIKGTAPDSYIDTVFLDKSLRISRSKNGKTFVFARV